MKHLLKGWATVAALLAGGLLAVPAPVLASPAGEAADLPGRMAVVDEAALFSPEAKKQAQTRMGDAKFNRSLQFHVDTYKDMPAEWKSKFDAATDKKKVVREWAMSVATGEKATGRTS